MLAYVRKGLGHIAWAYDFNTKPKTSFLAYVRKGLGHIAWACDLNTRTQKINFS